MIMHKFLWCDHVSRLTAADFQLRYRLDFEGFYDLLRMIKPALVVKDEQKARNAKWGDLVEPETKLAIALRFMAGGSPHDLWMLYDVT